MKSTSFNQEQQQDGKESIPVFGYELLRDILIPSLLGKDTAEISYWAGKNLARNFPLLTIQEISSFFQEAAWGQLNVIDENKNEMKLELSGPIVERRLHMNQDATFQLEAGFIAEQIEKQKHVVTEAHAETILKKNIVLITVRWDKHDEVL
ncbi:YslB family protein [Lederbergia graminis]|uniref:YslB family protein n=1 Tax=Lederbergia graminis TaxID=735518 RepID=A0ABW0LP48_9BACI|nr:YslB family protein [Paenibacillus bovis]